jgi:hypothetical protein
LESSNPPLNPEDLAVHSAVKSVMALRKLARDSNMQTNKSQTAILKTLPPEILARVAVILAEMEEGSR